MSLRRKPLLVTASIALVVIVFFALAFFLKDHFQESQDPHLATPIPLLAEILKSRTAESPVFVTPEFLPFRTSLPDSKKALLPSSGDSEAASRDKSAFWSLNREHHFGAVFLGVNPAWRSLSDSLLNSSLWVLSDVSPWGYLFRPGNAGMMEWKPPSEPELLERFPKTGDRAYFLILSAANLIAINRFADAEQMLDMAAETHRLPSLMQSTRASLAASRGQWEDAVALARESLRSDSSNRVAREILIRALIETGHADESLDQARDLISRTGEDESSLFLLARAASAANSGKEEADALARLVALGRRDKQPLGASLTYLGQAYAKQGDRGDSLRAFQEASLAPELTQEERTMIRNIMDHLMEGNASSTTLPFFRPSETNGANP